MFFFLIAVVLLSAVAPAYGQLLSFTEDCVRFDPTRLEPLLVVGAEPGRPQAYLDVRGGARLLSFPNHDEARRALEIIRNHGFNQQCFIGRPRTPFTYWKNGANVPSRSLLTGQDCITFRTDAVRIGAGGGGRPYILWDTSGVGHTLTAFGSSAANARHALELVRHYELDRVCYVGRPDASMTYWLSRVRPAERGEARPDRP
jgi:hypothetical protein